jgi:hypothetical protein
MFPRWLVQGLQPPQKSERPPFQYGWSYGIKSNASRQLSIDFRKRLLFGTKVIMERNRQMDRQADRNSDESHKPHFPFYGALKNLK